MEVALGSKWLYRIRPFGDVPQKAMVFPVLEIPRLKRFFEKSHHMSVDSFGNAQA